MSWSINADFTGQRPASATGGYPARGLYQAVTVKTELATGDNGANPRIQLTHNPQVAYLFDEKTGFAQGEETREIRNSLFIPTGDETARKALSEDDRKKVNMTESLLNAAIIAHGYATAEQIAATKQTMALGPHIFDGRPVWVLFDPPPLGSSGVYPEVRYVTPEDAQAIIAGKKKVVWPQERNSARAAQAAARAEAAAATVRPAGGAIGAMLPPGAAGAPANGAPAPAPAAAPAFGAAPAAAPAAPAPAGWGAPANGAPAPAPAPAAAFAPAPGGWGR